jgi:hypothetical protein
MLDVDVDAALAQRAAAMGIGKSELVEEALRRLPLDSNTDLPTWAQEIQVSPGSNQQVLELTA